MKYSSFYFYSLYNEERIRAILVHIHSNMEVGRDISSKVSKKDVTMALKEGSPPTYSLAIRATPFFFATFLMKKYFKEAIIMVDYRVVFEYEGKEPYALFKRNVEKLFVVGYNMYCDESNKHIAKYNSECGDLLGDAYNEYMCKRLSEDAETVFNRFTSINTLARRAFTKFVVEPPCVFKAILRNGTKMSIYLKEI